MPRIGGVLVEPQLQLIAERLSNGSKAPLQLELSYFGRYVHWSVLTALARLD